MPNEREENLSQTLIFQKGLEVGLLGQQFFPEGVLVNSESLPQRISETKDLIEKGQTIIYEAAFEFNSTYCAVDILVKENNRWYAYEVKSTNSIKDQFIKDLALQYYVLNGVGLNLHDVYVVHLNKHYIRNGELSLNDLFIRVSVLDQVINLQRDVESKVTEFTNVLGQNEEPKILTGSHCEKPYHCDFYSYCSKDLVHEEIDYGEPSFNAKAINDFIRSLQYPLYFMDFETWITAIPEYDGHWPYRQVNFQYSLHVQSSAGSEIVHYEYLAEGPHTLQREFIESLLTQIGEYGSIIVYNQAFENTRLKELKNEFPDLEERISSVQERIADLMVPFRRRDIYIPEMKGSYSIKYVLPALVPEMNYDNLKIRNGEEASSAFYSLKNIDHENERNEIRKSLLEYCGQDTLAMVKILDKLKEYV